MQQAKINDIQDLTDELESDVIQNDDGLEKYLSSCSKLQEKTHAIRKSFLILTAILIILSLAKI